jgi:hypothetical protein
MIIELKFEQLQPRCVPAYETAFEQALPERSALSPLGACWRTEVGNIDSVVQLWTYESLTQREKVLADAAKLPTWPPSGANEMTMEQEVMIITPAPFSPPITERRLGNIYELRIYSYAPGVIPTVIERWQEKIEARVRLSPLVMCGYTETGRMNQWVHLWAYENAVERQRIRAESIQQKIWPPDARAGLIRQQNMLLVPSRFSPLR